MGAGGLGAFGSNFATSFFRGVQNRRLRDQFAARQEMQAEREKRMAEQFATTQKFREDQAAKLEAYRQQQLAGQAEARAALETYHAQQQDLEQKRIDLQKKGVDLQVMDAWGKIMDPKLGKPQRKFMFKQLATGPLGIDPKSQEYKDFESMITSMDDESLQETYNQMATLLPKANPGQITAFSQAIIKGPQNGGISMNDAITQFGKINEQEQFSKIMSGDTGSEQTGVPTQQVQSSRITNPTPIAQQGMEAPSSIRVLPAGTLPVPGLALGKDGKVDAQPTDMSAEVARSKAAEFLKIGTENARSQAQALLQYARDKTDKFGLATVVDPNDPNKNKIIVYDKSNPDAALKGAEAPSARDVLTPDETAQAEERKALVQADVKRLEPFRADAEVARTVAGPLAEFRQVMETGKFTTGSFSGLRETMGRLAEFVGAPQEVQDALSRAGINDPASAEVMDSSAAKITSLLAERLGRVSNMQLGFVSQIGPQAWKTPQGNAMMIDLAQRENDRALKIEHKIDEYIDRYKTLRPAGKPSVWDEIDKIRSEPLVDKDWISKFKSEALKGKGMTWEDLLTKTPKLKIGDKNYEQTGNFEFTLPDGKTKKKLPQVRLEDGQDYPFAANAKEFNSLPKGTRALINPPGHEPMLMDKD